MPSYFAPDAENTASLYYMNAFAERQRVETSMLSGEMRYKIVRFISDEAWILAHMRKNMYLCKAKKRR